MPPQEVSFREALLALSDVLGATPKELTSRVGPPDDVSEDEHRAFLWYQNANAAFRVKAGKVDHLAIPIANAAGDPYTGPGEYFEFEGVRLGMSKDEVLAAWGAPQGQSNRAWPCRTIGTPNGKRVTLVVGFNEGSDGVLRVHQFGTRLAEPESAPEGVKGGCLGAVVAAIASATALVGIISGNA